MFNKIKNISIFKHYDYILLFSVLALTTLGYFAVDSATANMASGVGIMRTQMISIMMGLGLCIILSLIDYTYFKTWGLILFVLVVLTLLYTLFFGYGREVAQLGTNRWIIIGGYMFMPSEFGKLAYMMAIPALVDRLKEEFHVSKLILILVAAFLPIVLILLQPETGMAIVYLSGFLAVIFVYGIKYRYFLMGFLTFAISTPLLWYFALQDYQKKRIISFLNPGQDLSGMDYQTDRAQTALGSGQLRGSGLYQGLHTQSGESIPVKESDFIFSVIGEELGFIGAVAVILWFTIILMRCIYIAATAKDRFGSYMVIGFTAMLAFHYIENVGMNIGLLPVTGIPLPFISAGGSAMLANFMIIGLILSVSFRRKI